MNIKRSKNIKQSSQTSPKSPTSSATFEMYEWFEKGSYCLSVMVSSEFGVLFFEQKAYDIWEHHLSLASQPMPLVLCGIRLGEGLSSRDFQTTVSFTFVRDVRSSFQCKLFYEMSIYLYCAYTSTRVSTILQVMETIPVQYIEN